MANEDRVIGAFARQVEALDIELSVNAEGIYTVCSTSEPLFRYDAETKDEAARLVAQTLTSYGRLFFHLEGLEIPVQSAKAPASPVPVERGTPVGRLKPVFDLAA